MWHSYDYECDVPMNTKLMWHPNDHKFASVMVHWPKLILWGNPDIGSIWIVFFSFWNVGYSSPKPLFFLLQIYWTFFLWAQYAQHPFFTCTDWGFMHWLLTWCENLLCCSFGILNCFWKKHAPASKATWTMDSTRPAKNILTMGWCYFQALPPYDFKYMNMLIWCLSQ